LKKKQIFGETHTSPQMLDFASYAKSERKLKYFWTLMLSDATTKTKMHFTKKKNFIKRRRRQNFF